MVVGACNPSDSRGWGKRIAWIPGGGGCSELRWCHCTSAWGNIVSKQTNKHKVRPDSREWIKSSNFGWKSSKSALQSCMHNGMRGNYGCQIIGGWVQWLMPLLEAEAGGLLGSRGFRPAWATQQNPISQTNKKKTWAWWHVLVPATQEAKVGGSLEPRETEPVVSCYGTTALQPGWQSKTLSLKNKQKEFATHSSQEEGAQHAGQGQRSTGVG